MHARAARGEECLDDGPQALGVALDVGFDLEVTASEENRHAVVSDGSRHQHPVAGSDLVGSDVHAGGDQAHTARGDVHAVGLAALDDLGVTRDDGDAGHPARRCHGVDFGAQGHGIETLLEDQRGGDRNGAGSGHREVVDGAVDRQLTDGAARKAERVDHEGVGRERGALGSDADLGGIVQGRERRAVDCGAHEGGDDHALDHGSARLATGTVRHRDAFVGEARCPTAGLLDLVEHLLLAEVGHVATVAGLVLSRTCA